jgi:hypothetical protein
MLLLLWVVAQKLAPSLEESVKEPIRYIGKEPRNLGGLSRFFYCWFPVRQYYWTGIKGMTFL